MKILMTWTGSTDPRRSWEWRLGEYLEDLGHDVLFAQDEISSGFEPDFIIATDFMSATIAKGWHDHFDVSFAVQCNGILPPPEEGDGYWQKVRDCADEAAVIVCVSESARDHLEVSYDPQPPVEINYQGVDDKKAERYEKASPDHFVWIGPFEHRKNPVMAIEAFSQVEEDLVMIGNTGDWDSYVPENVDAVGQVDDDEKFQLISHATALVTTTRGEEFFIPAAEAGYFGIPLVLPESTDEDKHWVSVFPELYGDTPYYFDDVEGLIEKIRAIVNDPEEAAKRGEQIQNTVKDKGLTMSRHAERWDRILQEYSMEKEPETGLKVNIGSFTVMHDKPWINIDKEDLRLYAEKEGYRFEHVDVLEEPLPFEEESVEYINASHIVEHMTPGEARGMLVKCRRALKPGGMIRIGFPNIDTITAHFLDGTIDKLSEGQPMDLWEGATDARKFWLLATSGHKTFHNINSVNRLLRKSGFDDLHQCQANKSKNRDVQSELKDMYPASSSYIEAVKPDVEEDDIGYKKYLEE